MKGNRELLRIRSLTSFNALIFIVLSALCFHCEEPKSPNEPLVVEEMILNNLADISYTKSRFKSDDFKYTIVLGNLIANADSALKKDLLSVVSKERFPPSGDKHDYMSVGPYWWPNPDTEKGLPYIRKDGEVNPERYAYPDAESFKNLAYRSRDLLYAYYFTDNQAYAKKAAEMVDTWFIADSTRMNPHLDYAQAIPGINEGRFIGIIDINMMVSLLEVLPILEASPYWTEEQNTAFKSWFDSFLTWLLESEFGQRESIHPNNHGTWYDVTVVSIAKYLGNKALAYQLLLEGKETRFDHHLAADGSQPHEVERTKSVSYSTFNLKGLMYLALIAEDLGINLWNYKNKHGVTIEDGLLYLKRYVDDPEAWPHPQIKPFDESRLTELFVIGAKKYNNDALFTSAAAILQRSGDDNNYTNLLFVNDELLIDVSEILEYSANKLSKLYSLSEKRSEIPRSYYTDTDEVRWRPAKDWTSGFFAGSLWYQYELTKEEKWKLAAEKETVKISEQQYYEGSHDVGFQIMSSYGLGSAFADMSGYDTVIINTAKSLATRFNPKVGAIKSWDWGDIDKYRVIIDNMINLELLFKATALTGDSAFYKIAVSHADKTLTHHFRADASTYHVLEYDTLSGEPLVKRTHQGYADSSAWARGQGWALYGYTLCYRYTQDEKYLDRAEKVADFILNHPNMPFDGIPFWDFDHPEIPDTYLDVSSAGVYASALLRLTNFTKDKHKSKRYFNAAQRMILSMNQNHRAADDVPFLLDHSVGDLPQGHEIDVPINYADFYFLEALYLYQDGK